MVTGESSLEQIETDLLGSELHLVHPLAVFGLDDFDS